MINMGDRIKELREDAHMTQDELAEILCVNRATVSGYETNKILPPLDVLIIIANTFNVSLDYLACRTKLMYNTNMLPKVSREIVHAIIQILNKYIK